MFEGTLICTIPEVRAPAPPARQLYIIEEGDGIVRFLHAGKEIKKSDTYCDVGEAETCIQSAIERAKQLCDHYAVTPESSLEVVVDHRRYRVIKSRNKTPDDARHQRKYEWERDQSRVRDQECFNRVWSSKEPDVIHPSPPLPDYTTTP